MTWTIFLYESSRSEKPIDLFIKQQQPQAQAKILHKITLLQQYGIQLGMPHTKKLASSIFELRIRGKEEIRILYCFKNKTIYLLHAFKKQTQKTPKTELKTAVKRFNSLNI